MEEARYHHTWRPHKPLNASPEQKNLSWKVVNAASLAVAALVSQRPVMMSPEGGRSSGGAVDQHVGGRALRRSA